MSISLPQAEPESVLARMRRVIPWRFIRLAIGLILLVLVLRLVDWPAFVQSLRTARPEYIALALSINVITLLLSAWRWQILLRSEGVHVSVFKLASYYLVSLFFNNYLPPFVGADAVRMLSVKESKSPGVRVVSVLVERGSGMAMLLLLGCIAVLANAGLRQYLTLDVFIFLALFAVAGALVTLLFPETWLWAVGITRRIPRLHPILLDIAAAGKRYRSKRSTLAETFLISALIQILIVFAFEFRALTFGVPIGIGQLLLVVPAITLLTLIPISPGGLGTQESFFTLMLGTIGIGSTTAIAMALLARALDLVMGICGAVVWLRDR
jgi:uncharacterized protein (TIRG00374 family)